MSKIPLFIIHGVGDYVNKVDGKIVHDPAWFNQIKLTLNNAFDSYVSLKGIGAFADLIEVIDISYDTIFQGIVDRWDESKVALTKGLGGKDLGIVSKAIETLDAILKNEKVTTHVLDVFFYNFVATTREAVKTSVTNQMRTALKARKSRWRGEWHVIGHSMGTAVAHDALHSMFTDSTGDFTTKDCWCGGLMMVANTSRLLEDKRDSHWDVYKSLVKPQILAGKTACSHYLNVWHELDPIAMPRAFRPDTSWVDATTFDERYHGIHFNDARSRDIHALENYLENPDVHQPLFQVIFGKDAIPSGELDKARKSYRDQTVQGEFDSLRDALKKVTLADGASWTEVVKKFADFRTMIKAFVK